MKRLAFSTDRARALTSASVSVGTLYQFFDNKDDLMQAIAEEHLAAMQTFRAELYGPDAIYAPPDILVGRTIDWLVTYNAENPTFNQIFSGAWTDPALLATLEETTGAIITDLMRVVRHHAPQLSEEQTHTGAAVLVYVIKEGMLGLLEATPAPAHPGILAEIKQMSLLYFNDLVNSSED